MIPFTWSRGMFFVPRKFMCSTQCDTPVCPGVSSFDPTLYQHHTEASGAVWTSWTITVSPLPSVVSRNPGVCGACTVMAALYRPDPRPFRSGGRRRGARAGGRARAHLGGRALALQYWVTLALPP